jgi:type I restriction enzyme S subunit
MPQNKCNFSWINTDNLNERIDAQFYQQKYIEAERKVLNLPTKRFHKLWKESNRIYIGIAGFKDISQDKKYTPYIRPTDVGPNGEVDWNDIAWCYSSWLNDHKPKGCAKEGDLLVEVKGNTKRAALVNSFVPDDCIVSGSFWRIQLKSEVSKEYILSFLLSDTGQLLKRRLISNSVIPWIDPASFKSFNIPIPDYKVQAYIGEKVCLAEKCREVANSFKLKAKTEFETSLQWDTKLELPLLSHWALPDLMSSRMDLNFNSPRKIQLIEFLKDGSFECKQLESLVHISAMIGWKGLTTEHYVDEGPWLLRGVEYRDGYIDFDAMVSVEQYKYDEQPQIHLKYKDIAMTKDGTIGKALVVPKLKKPMAAGSTIARLRIKNGKAINPYYLELAINHPVVQIQIQSFATGLAQPHITQEWIAQLIIPRVESKEKEISTLIEKHHYLMQSAHDLSKETKSDVEALIEGKLDVEAVMSGKLKAPTWEDIEKELEGI